ncbi:MAG: epoxyqueuosine reductase QueH [Deferribacteres bacterium]|nr:epoxyqueuosine reductase QueH [Deferribacteres bacterium]
MAKILIHVCCANCLLYPLRLLEKEFDEVYAYWFNPNIHPYQEYVKRLEAMKRLQELKGLKVIYNDEYDVAEFVRNVAFREGKRCEICYYLRLSRCASVAKRGNFDFFTTTLLYSKHQKHAAIIEIAEAVAKEKGVPFYYADFREGWRDGIEESLQLKLYRQQYCGCIYSEQERFLKGRS